LKAAQFKGRAGTKTAVLISHHDKE
jgi:hypothetical protein